MSTPMSAALGGGPVFAALAFQSCVVAARIEDCDALAVRVGEGGAHGCDVGCGRQSFAAPPDRWDSTPSRVSAGRIIRTFCRSSQPPPLSTVGRALMTTFRASGAMAWTTSGPSRFHRGPPPVGRRSPRGESRQAGGIREHVEIALIESVECEDHDGLAFAGDSGAGQWHRVVGGQQSCGVNPCLGTSCGRTGYAILGADS